MPEEKPGNTSTDTVMDKFSEINFLNGKAVFDETFKRLSAQSPYPTAWEQLSLRMANDAASLSTRIANNGASFDHAVNMGSLLSAQAGVTEAQQTVSPIKVGAADAQNQQPAGAVYPPIRNVDQAGATATNVVQTALSSVAGQIAALTDVVTKLAEAMLPVIVNSAGGASTPSQTQPKP